MSGKEVVCNRQTILRTSRYTSSSTLTTNLTFTAEANLSEFRVFCTSNEYDSVKFNLRISPWIMLSLFTTVSTSCSWLWPQTKKYWIRRLLVELIGSFKIRTFEWSCATEWLMKTDSQVCRMAYLCSRLKGALIINIRTNFSVSGTGSMNSGDGFTHFRLNFFTVGKFIHLRLNSNTADLKDVNNGEVCKELGSDGFTSQVITYTVTQTPNRERTEKRKSSLRNRNLPIFS